MKIVNFSLKDGSKYFGQIDGDEFFIGSRVAFRGTKGLMNVSGDSRDRYDRDDFQEFGFWADFIHPIAAVEGALFHTLNTYDRARFTFSFLQFAAHVPNGDFVVYMRELLKMPVAHDYFPDLSLQQGRICKESDEGIVVLETDSSTAPLLDYLNPNANEVEDTEIIQAAKFVHWARNDPDHRRLQVRLGVEHLKASMVKYADRYALDGTADKLCLVIADIRHQGRGRSPEIVAALRANDPYEALLAIGSQEYPHRVATLRKEIDALVAHGVLGTRRYVRAKADFISLH